MYRLKETGVVVFGQIVQKLAPYGYTPTPFTPGYCKHDTRPTMFTLCVEYFGAKYFSKDYAMHLINDNKDNYKIKNDWTGSLYCGLTLDWHFNEGFFYIYMPGYVNYALRNFDHPLPKRPQHVPHKCVKPIYGSRQQQQPTVQSTAEPLEKSITNRVQ